MGTEHRPKIKEGMVRFFMGVRELTKESTATTRSRLLFPAQLELPSTATLNNVLRRRGVEGPVGAERFIKERTLGTLRMQVFSGGLWPDVPRRGRVKHVRRELAIVYEPWSGALYTEVGESFRGPEEIERCLRRAVGAFPKEFAENITDVLMLQREPAARVTVNWLTKRSSGRDGPLIDADELNRHAPRRIGKFRVWSRSQSVDGLEEESAFRFFLAKLTGDYNCLGAGEQKQGHERRIEALDRTGESKALVGQLLPFADRATKGCLPAVRVFAAVSRVEPAYTWREIIRGLSPNPPEERRRRSKGH